MGYNGFARRSVDSGTTWLTPTSVPAGIHFLDVDMADATTGYAVENGPSVLKTVDGGDTWSTLTGPWSLSQHISVVSSQVAWVAAQSSGVFVTRDGGATWNTEAITGTIFGIAGVDTNRAIATGYRSETAYVGPAAGATSQVADYGAPPNNWANGGGGGNMFAVCLQSKSAPTVINSPTWDLDLTPPCTATDTDKWWAIPAVATKIASTPTAGALGRIDVVWGFRPSDTQAAMKYQATVVFEAVAPAV